MRQLNSLSEQPPEILHEIGKHLDLPALRNLRHTNYTFYTHYYQQQCDSLQKANRINSISAGRSHTLALTESGEVYSWGSNNHSQLGLGNINHRLVPTFLAGVSEQKIVSITAGDDHSLALTQGGELYSWGRNDYGQLGLGDTNNRLVPTFLAGVSEQKIVSVTAGGFHCLALTADGKLYSWGNNSDGQLGLGDTNNRLVPTFLAGVSEQKNSVGSSGWFPLLSTH